MSATNEIVPFRFIVCPECEHQMCWVNPRLPNYCPECGKHIFLKVRSNVHIHDPEARLRYDQHINADKAVGRGKW